MPKRSRRARRGADERELGQIQPQAARAGPFADHDIQREVLHRGIEHLLHRVAQAVNLVDEQHVAAGEVGQHAGQVSRALDRGAAGDADVLPHLRRHDARQRRLAQARRAVEQDVVQRLTALPRGLDVYIEAFLDGFLADVLRQRMRAKAALLLVLLAEAAHHQAFFLFPGHCVLSLPGAQKSAPLSTLMLSFFRLQGADLL